MLSYSTESDEVAAGDFADEGHDTFDTYEGAERGACEGTDDEELFNAAFSSEPAPRRRSRQRSAARRFTTGGMLEQVIPATRTEATLQHKRTLLTHRIPPLLSNFHRWRGGPGGQTIQNVVTHIDITTTRKETSSPW